MTKEEYLAELNKAFGDFKFFADDHHYEYKGKRVGISVTTFYALYENEFDAQKMARDLSLKTGKPASEYIKEWEYKRDFSCDKGTATHEYVQSLFSGAEYKELYFDGSPEYFDALKKCKVQAYNFYRDYKDLYEHLADEYTIGSEEYDIASNIDHLFINKNTGGLVLIDYKSNSDIYKKERYNNKMLMPLDHLKDTDLNHYALQLSIYKYIVEKYTSIKFEDMFIVWFSEKNDNYKIVEVPYLEKEAKKILDLRRANKMAKMILVMGEPASGKTVSLRNIPKKELYYVDCDKKGLNYKGWKNDFNEENKNYCKTNEGEVVKKILEGISKTREDIHYIAIDTVNSIMIADEMTRMKGKNYNEWQDLAKCIFELIDIVPDLRDDITVVFNGHIQTDDDGFVRLLTNGRKLNKIGLEKYFDTVLISKVVDGKYVFETRSDKSTARVPMGFECEQYIDNDLYEVIKELKEF